jgi:hypothetical protein
LIFYYATSDSKAGRKYQELWKPYHHFAPHQTRFDTLPEKSKCRILENHRDYFDKGRITQLSPRALSRRDALWEDEVRFETFCRNEDRIGWQVLFHRPKSTIPKGL